MFSNDLHLTKVFNYLGTRQYRKTEGKLRKIVSHVLHTTIVSHALHTFYDDDAGLKHDITTHRFRRQLGQTTSVSPRAPRVARSSPKVLVKYYIREGLHTEWVMVLKIYYSYHTTHENLRFDQALQLVQLIKTCIETI